MRAWPACLALAASAALAADPPQAQPDALQKMTERPADGSEPALSANEPVYFVVGTRGGTTARFQISFKYRPFDPIEGTGHDLPWLSQLFFGYTQNSIWDLSSESKPFRDTNYRPSLFWWWQRGGEELVLRGARLGLEHESNGGEGENSRSINTAFVRPEWRWPLADGASFEFAPKVYAYLDKDENPDIAEYRGYVDWHARFDSGQRWVANAMARLGTSGKGSVQLDLMRSTSEVRFGPARGYLHLQFFAGYGESLVDYNLKRKSQLRFGFAIVP